MRTVNHILYSGLGGHGEYVFSLINGDPSIKHRLIFFGVEPVKEEYIQFCKESDIEWTYVRKSRLSWIFKLNRLLNGKDTYVFHSSISVIPALLFHASKPFSSKNFIYVEHQANHLKSKVDWLCSRASQLICNSIVFLTPEYKKEVKLKIGRNFNEQKSQIILTGIDEAYWSSSNKTTLSETITIGMQGRMFPIKDFKTVMYAVKEMKEKGHKVIAEFAGDGPEINNLKKLSQKLEIEEDIIFHGSLDRNQLRSFLSRIDIYVHSTFGETFSTAILQAMSMKKPIVASNVKGINNILEDQKEALLFKVEDSTDLANKIIDLIQSDNKAKYITHNSLLKLKCNFTRERMVNSFRELYFK